MRGGNGQFLLAPLAGRHAKTMSHRAEDLTFSQIPRQRNEISSLTKNHQSETLFLAMCTAQPGDRRWWIVDSGWWMVDGDGGGGHQPPKQARSRCQLPTNSHCFCLLVGSVLCHSTVEGRLARTAVDDSSSTTCLGRIGRPRTQLGCK